MKNLVKLLSMIFLVPLVVLSITACTTNAGYILVLNVDSPHNGTTVNTSQITVSGSVSGSQSESASVDVNGDLAAVKEGKFSTEITLNPGENTIEVAARTGDYSQNKTLTVTYTPD